MTDEIEIFGIGLGLFFACSKALLELWRGFQLRYLSLAATFLAGAGLTVPLQLVEFVILPAGTEFAISWKLRLALALGGGASAWLSGAHIYAVFTALLRGPRALGAAPSKHCNHCGAMVEESSVASGK